MLQLLGQTHRVLQHLSKDNPGHETSEQALAAQVLPAPPNSSSHTPRTAIDAGSLW